MKRTRDFAIKERQSKVVIDGRKLEDEIINYINERLNKKNIKAVRFNSLNTRQKSLLGFTYTIEEKIEYIDADIVVINKMDQAIICAISVKKSLRERGGQTAYWALKKKIIGKPFAYIFVTPDVDQELLEIEKPTKVKKWRNILTYETDGVFVWTDKIIQEKTEDRFYIGKEKLIQFIEKLI